MKFILSSALVMALFFAPLAAWGAYNDVTLTTDTVLSVGGATINVSGSSAAVESIVVNENTFNVTLPANSSITVASQGRADLNANVDTYTTLDNCDTLTLTGSGAGAAVTITPDTVNTCSSGGGGGTRKATAPKSVTPPVAAPAPSSSSELSSLLAQLRALIVQAQALGIAISPAASALVGDAQAFGFTRDLTVGALGEDVRALQVYLNAHDAVIADSGPGSMGNETTMFGALTKAALAKFQASVGISPATGYFGPKTRAYITAHP